MSSNSALPIIVFDVNETLLDITSIEPLFERIFDDKSVLREWFAQLILYSQTLTLSGLYIPFGQLGGGALRMVAATHGISVTERDVEELSRRVRTMPAHSDVDQALSLLRDAGFRLVTLSNSASSGFPTPLEQAGIADYFERSFSVDSVKQFKPAPETYQYVAQQLAVAPHELCLVACHLWDVIGAQSLGASGAFLQRSGNALLPVEGVPVPDFQAAGLVELATQLIRDFSS